MSDKKVIDAMWDDSPVDVSTEVNFIWSIANKLRGTYQSDKYKDVIIPMVIIRRFECALAPTKAKVVEMYKKNPSYPAKAMYRLSGFQFYNTSEYDLAELINDSDHLAANFKSYLQGFSSNIQDIIRSLDFDKQIDKMDKNNRLLPVVKAFSELDLNPLTIDNVKMGYIFEELIRKFSENAEAGDHYTGRDIIKLMVNILLAEGCDDIFDDGKVITVLDQACGTGGMLSTSYNFIKRYNPTADVRLFGQEINPESYAICLAEMMIKGQNAENICYQDTMKADRFENVKMRFVIENPPFGTPWGGKDAAEGVEQAVQAEYEKGFDGRWGAGLPGSGDMQMLFLQSAIDKMDDNLGRAAIIENGSPLFAGSTASGESQIRRWMLENDLIEATKAVTKGINPDIKMKDSNIRWIGEIPSHWKVMPNKYLMYKKKVICPVYNGEDILSLTMQGVIVRDLNAGGKMPTSFDGYQYLEPGNLLMCLFDIDVTPRCIGLIKQSGVSSPAYSQFVLKEGAYAAYYNYYYTMLDNDKTLLHLAKNLRHSLTEEQLGAIPTVVPPVEEQKEISVFLDTKLADIDAVIAEKKEQLTVLGGYKSSLIYEYVTGKKEVPGHES